MISQQQKSLWNFSFLYLRLLHCQNCRWALQIEAGVTRFFLCINSWEFLEKRPHFLRKAMLTIYSFIQFTQIFSNFKLIHWLFVNWFIHFLCASEWIEMRLVEEQISILKILTMMIKGIAGKNTTYTGIIIHVVAVDSLHSWETLSYYETTFSWRNLVWRLFWEYILKNFRALYTWRWIGNI